MDVGGYDCKEEEDAVHDQVHFGAAEQGDA